MNTRQIIFLSLITATGLIASDKLEKLDLEYQYEKYAYLNNPNPYIVDQELEQNIEKSDRELKSNKDFRNMFLGGTIFLAPLAAYNIYHYGLNQSRTIISLLGFGVSGCAAPVFAAFYEKEQVNNSILHTQENINKNSHITTNMSNAAPNEQEQAAWKQTKERLSQEQIKLQHQLTELNNKAYRDAKKWHVYLNNKTTYFTVAAGTTLGIQAFKKIADNGFKL